MATGYRLAYADDYAPAGPFADGVTTTPGTVSESFWVLNAGEGLAWLGRIAYYQPEATMVIQTVTYDAGDVIRTQAVKADGRKVGTAISGGTVEDTYTTGADFSALGLGTLP